MRNKIKEKLLEIDDKIYYGRVPRLEENEDWNYFVFNQDKIKKSGTSLVDFNGYWNIVIVRENFIPDDLIFDVVEKITEIPGLRLADGDNPYEYEFKGNTNIVCEILQLKFTKTKKRC